MSPSNSNLTDFSSYKLPDLLKEHGYKFIASHNDVDTLIDSLQLPAPQADKVTIIGVNGPTCAGKTTFSQILASRLAGKVPAVELSFEWFLHDRKRRVKLVEDVALGIITIPEVTNAAWDAERYISILRRIKNMNLNTDDSVIRLDNLSDRVSGSKQYQTMLNVPYGGYVVVEGVSVLDVKDTELVDCYIRLDIDDDHGLLERIVARENSKPATKRLSESFLNRRFKVMDLNHMRYLRKISHNHNKYIIDTSNFNHMRVYTNAKLS